MFEVDNMSDDGEDNACSRIGGSCAACCFGTFILFPAAIMFTFWNEKHDACRQWAIDEASKEAKMLDCAQHLTDTSGASLEPGSLGFLSCDLNTLSFKDFTHKDFNGLSVPNLFNLADAKGTGMQMHVSQWQCEEYCERESCSRRLEEVGSSNSTEEIERKSRRLGKGSDCTNRCVQYGYRRTLRTSAANTVFQDHTRAQQQCGANYNNAPQPLSLGTHDVHAGAGTITTLPGDQWRLSNKQIQQFPIDKPVILNKWSPSLTVNGATTAPATLSRDNTWTDGSTLKTCTTDSIGCIEVTFTKAAPSRVAAMGAMSDSPGSFKEEGWTAPGYWLCKGSAANHVDMVCPSSGQTLDQAAYKGILSCGEDVVSFDQSLELMKSAKSFKTWGFRFIGFFMFWFAFCCFFSPLQTCLAFSEDIIDTFADCIPCVGCIVDVMTDIFFGIASAIVSLAACCCGMGWFLSVVVVTWIVMRPLLGAFAALFACCFCGGAMALLYTNKGGGKPKQQRFNEMDNFMYE